MELKRRSSKNTAISRAPTQLIVERPTGNNSALVTILERDNVNHSPLRGPAHMGLDNVMTTGHNTNTNRDIPTLAQSRNVDEPPQVT